jgi:hypothetical protein
MRFLIDDQVKVVLPEKAYSPRDDRATGQNLPVVPRTVPGFLRRPVDGCVDRGSDPGETGGGWTEHHTIATLAYRTDHGRDEQAQPARSPRGP